MDKIKDASVCHLDFRIIFEFCEQVTFTKFNKTIRTLMYNSFQTKRISKRRLANRLRGRLPDRCHVSCDVPSVALVTTPNGEMPIT